MRHRLLTLAVLFTSAGCGLLLGLEDKQPFPGDAGVDAGTLDGSVTDAPPNGDAAPDAADGGCPRDCLGGSCEGGVCSVVTLARTQTDAGDAAPGTETPTCVTAHGDFVFWSTSKGNVFRCERKNCSASAQAIATTSAPDGGGYSAESTVLTILADATHVYWAQYYEGKIFRAGHDGSGRAGRSAQGSPTSLVIDATNLYWLNFGAGSSAVWRVPLASFAIDPAAKISDPYLSSTPPAPDVCSEPENRCWYGYTMAANGDLLVFNDAKPFPRGEILTVPKNVTDGAVSLSGHAGFYEPTSLVALDQVVYFTQYGPRTDAGLPSQGEIIKLQANMVPTPLVKNQSEPESLATDGIDLFWAARGAGAIRRCAIGGCEFNPQTLATNQRYPTSLVVRDGVLYWVNASGTEVNMLVVR